MEPCDLYIVGIILLAYTGVENRAEDTAKRILLNDQSFIQQELDQLKTQLQVQQDKITELESKNDDLQILLRNSAKNSGAVYTRWGKKTCAGNNTELIYSGYVGGPWYNKPGSGNNPVCLSPDPLWDHHNDHAAPHGANIYGAEYEGLEYALGLDNENVPCAVCWAPSAVATLMIPGRNKCYGDWNEEYHGYLVANREGYQASIQYTCMDASPDVLDSGHNNDDGLLFETVEGRCGSLPCPPYVNGREITCVVCSK